MGCVMMIQSISIEANVNNVWPIEYMEGAWFCVWGDA